MHATKAQDQGKQMQCMQLMLRIRVGTHSAHKYDSRSGCIDAVHVNNAQDHGSYLHCKKLVQKDQDKYMQYMQLWLRIRISTRSMQPQYRWKERQWHWQQQLRTNFHSSVILRQRLLRDRVRDILHGIRQFPVFFRRSARLQTGMGTGGQLHAAWVIEE